MENLSTLEMGLVLIAAAVFVPLAIWWMRKMDRNRKAEEATAFAKLEEQQAEARQQQVRKGTHDPHGYRLCITCGDKQTRATQPAFVVKQSEDLGDLIKRWFGAPARYTIKQLKKGEAVPNVYCDECADLMKLEHEEYILRYEGKIRAFKRDAGVELRRWLKHGCNDAVVHLIEEHEEKVKKYEPQPKRAAVVPLKTESNGT
jgi:hypothetical protein